MLKAIFFDQDGVIVDTERDGHRIAFNRTFSEFGLPIEWSVEEYGELLRIGGGKERTDHFLRTHPGTVDVDGEALAQLVRDLHARKTEIFVEMIENGSLPLRPGVSRIMRAANECGIIVGICTTSNEHAARAIQKVLLNDVTIDFTLAGDVVTHKKPDPEIYRRAIELAGVRPEQIVVIEDSRIGISAARSAGLHVLATANDYTVREDLSRADAVVDCLGESNGVRAKWLTGEIVVGPRGIVTLEDLAALTELDYA